MSNLIGAQWQAGDLILNRYKVIGILGQTGLGEVYKVRHLDWNIDLAVKSPKPEVIAALGGDRFAREVEAWANLGLHPHVASCYYLRQVEGAPLVFVEYVAGGSLQDWIHNRRLYADAPVRSLKRILDIAIQAAWGLHYAHEHGLVHQHVAPENVLVTPEGTVKITDFGLVNTQAIASVLDSQLVSSSNAVGNLQSSGRTMTVMPGYQAPEQASQIGITRQTDLWSWGLLVLEMFSGGRTWTSGALAMQSLDAYLHNTPNSQIPRMPEPIVQLLRDCFRNNPEERPPTLAAIANQLRQIYQQVVGETCLRHEPDITEETADSLNNRAVCLSDLGRVEEALRYWEKALTIQPQHQESIYNRGLVLWRSGQTDDLAVLTPLEASRSHEKDWNLEYLLSLVHLERGDYQAALEKLTVLQNAGIEREEVEAAFAVAREATAATRSLFPNAERLREFAHPDVTSIALSLDSRYAVSGSGDKTVRLWEMSTGRCLCIFRGHKAQVSSVAFSPNGNYILSGSWDKTIKLCEVVTTSYLHTFKGHRGAVQTIAFSGSGYYFLSGSDDRTIKLWEITTGKCLRTFKGHRGRITSVSFSPGDRYVLSASEDKTLKLWDINSGRCLWTFNERDSYATTAIYSPDGQQILSANHLLKLWAADTGAVLRTFQGHSLWVRSAAFSASGRYLVSASDDATVKLWETATGRCIRTFQGHQFPVSAVTASAEGNYALSTDSTGVKLWAINTAALPYTAPLRLSQIQAPEAAQSSDLLYEQALMQAQTAEEQGDWVAAAQHLRYARSQLGYQHAPEAMQLWINLYTHLPRQTLNGGWECATFDRHTAGVNAVACSSDSDYALSASRDRTIKLWEIGTGRCLRSLEGHREAVQAVVFNADGAYALSGSADSTLKLWAVATGSCVGTLRGHQDAVLSVSWSFDQDYALSGSADGTLRLWEVMTGRCLRSLEGHSAPVYAVAFSPDSLCALSGSADQTVRIWEVATGQCLQIFTGHVAAIRAVAWSPEGRYVLSGGEDAVIRLWETATGEVVRRLEGHTAAVRSLAFSPDGRFAASAGDDRTLRVWEIATGACLRIFEGHQAAICSIVFSADSSYILSGSDDAMLKLWTLDWELTEKSPATWDEGARAYLETFLTLHTAKAGVLPKTREPSQPEIVAALSRRGIATWTEADFQGLVDRLRYAGYGWLHPEGIRQQLEALAATAKPIQESSSATAFVTAFDTSYETAFATSLVEPSAPPVQVVLAVTEGNLAGQVFEFRDRTTCIIGRAKDCNLQLPNDEYHKTISRYHCLLDINPPTVRIRDLGSLHGTYVNGQIIGRRQPNQTAEEVAQMNFPEHDLAEGDEIKLGKTVFQIRIEGISSDATSFATSMVPPSDQTAFGDISFAAPSPPASSGGSGLDGYTFVQPLGTSTFGEIHLARRHQTDGLVVVKVMQPKMEVRPSVIDAFLQEVGNIKALQHPHIVPLLDSGYSNGKFFCVMEYCQKGNLIDRMQQQGGRLAIDQAVAIILQVLEGLEYAHAANIPHVKLLDGSFSQGQGFVHRDLKPANILLTELNGTEVVKIADYGLLKAFDQSGLSSLSMNSISATAALFMPRQRAIDFQYAKPDVDVWTSAACLYYLLTGAYPRDFTGKDPYLALLQNDPVPIRQRDPSIPKLLAEVIDIAVTDKPEIQFKTVAALKRALQSSL
ncbi:MAG: hypothetical protein Kow00121_22260 [Elainellaceae cyanobacterium]